MNFRNTTLDIISQVLEIPRENIQESDKLAELVKDSIQLFELLIRFEQEFGKKISYEEIADVETVGDILNLGEKTLDLDRSKYRYELVQTPEETRACTELVKRVYAVQGYVGSNSEKTDNQNKIEANTKVFSAYKQDSLFGTIALINDSRDGLPMDILYQDDLAPLRREGKKLAEVGKFAVDHSHLEEDGMGAALPLLSLVIESALNHGVDYLCITINPKHDSFYKTLGFTEMGETKLHPGVNNAPAVLRILNTKEILKNKNWKESLTAAL